MHIMFKKKKHCLKKPLHTESMWDDGNVVMKQCGLSSKAVMH